jgi:hypothetical protein
MPRLALDGDCGRARVRIALDDTTLRCAPCAAPITDPDILDELAGRVIVRHRTQTGTDDDGTPEYGWATLYDGPGYWSDHTIIETSDAAGTGTETATVRVPPFETDLGTAASVWDHNETRWTVTSVTTSPIGDTLINLERVVDSDT